MTAPTPGPWERSVYAHGGSRIYRGDALIADTFNPGDSDLLFAAPDLYAALVAIVKVIDRADDRECPAAALEMARAAIAKAEGRSNG